MSGEEFTEFTLPNAIAWLFEVNGHTVEPHGRLAGADVDLIATQRDALRPDLRTYIEATVEYVDYVKYGKDLQKLDLYRDEPGAIRMIVSSKGFTAPVKERAKQSGILTLTYDELFARFERFEPYIRTILEPDSSERAVELQALDEVYQEPSFSAVSEHKSRSIILVIG